VKTDLRPQLAWLIAFVSSIIADIQEPFPKYAWWTVAYMLACIIGIVITFATNATQTYNVAVRYSSQLSSASD
jgi:SHO1 osmosensor